MQYPSIIHNTCRPQETQYILMIRFEDECMEIQSSKPSLKKIKLKKEMSFKYNKRVRLSLLQYDNF